MLQHSSNESSSNSEEETNSQSECEENEYDQDENDNSDDNSGLSWIEWFCTLPGHDFLCVVNEEFIDDPFNLVGLFDHRVFVIARIRAF